MVGQESRVIIAGIVLWSLCVTITFFDQTISILVIVPDKWHREPTANRSGLKSFSEFVGMSEQGVLSELDIKLPIKLHNKLSGSRRVTFGSISRSMS